MTIRLRPDQLALQQDVWSAWQSGARDVLAVLPTGGGKSVIASDTVKKFDANGQSTILIAHRQELVGQMSLHIARQGVRHRIIAPKPVVNQIMALHRSKLQGQCYINPTSNNAVAGVDTIVSRETELADLLARFDLCVTDESHHLLRENKWGKARDLCKRALGLGITASPKRADGKGLGRHHDGFFDRMCVGPDMRSLINLQALCDYEIVCPPSDFPLDELKIGESGDITQASMKAASEKSRIVGDVVENYCLHAYGTRAIVFATDVETAGKMADRFNLFGIPAACISAKTHDTVRDDVIRRLEDGRLWVVVNVDLLGEGFDLPAVQTVIMARPTASLAVYLQQFGRALRILAGKLFGLVIDHVSNIKRHGFPDRPQYWSLDRTEKKRPKDPELVDMIICDNCTKPYEAIKHECPHCRKPPSAPAGRSPIEIVKGDLTRLDAATLAKMRKATAIASIDEKVSQAVYASGGMVSRKSIAEYQTAAIDAHRQLQDAIAQWAGYQRWKGREDGEIHMRFYHAAGLDVLSALSGDRTKQEYQELTEKVLSWIR